MTGIGKTPEQRELVKIVLDAMSAGQVLTIGEVFKRISYTGGYGSIRTSIRKLEKHGVFKRKRKGHDVRVYPTQKAYELFVFEE